MDTLRGLTRREIVRLLSSSGALAALGASIGLGPRQVWGQGTPDDRMAIAQKTFVKEVTKNFYALAATVVGSHWWKFTTDIVSSERLFLRSRYKTPTIDKSAWKLTVTAMRSNAP